MARHHLARYREPQFDVLAGPQFMSEGHGAYGRLSHISGSSSQSRIVRRFSAMNEMRAGKDSAQRVVECVLLIWDVAAIHSRPKMVECEKPGKGFRSLLSAQTTPTGRNDFSTLRAGMYLFQSDRPRDRDDVFLHNGRIQLFGRFEHSDRATACSLELPGGFTSMIRGKRPNRSGR